MRKRGHKPVPTLCKRCGREHSRADSCPVVAVQVRLPNGNFQRRYVRAPQEKT